MDMDGFVLWGKSMDEPCLASTLPHDGKDATHGNGTMVALRMNSTEAVDAFYAKAMELGATDEGPAGPRGDDSTLAISATRTATSSALSSPDAGVHMGRFGRERPVLDSSVDTKGEVKPWVQPWKRCPRRCRFGRISMKPAITEPTFGSPDEIDARLATAEAKGFIKMKPISANLGVEVECVDLKNMSSAPSRLPWSTTRLIRHKVLVFKKIGLNHEQQVRFTYELSEASTEHRGPQPSATLFLVT